jgi:hypothetical protein
MFDCPGRTNTSSGVGRLLPDDSAVANEAASAMTQIMFLIVVCAFSVAVYTVSYT